ncbi:alpha/beta hydrolase [Ectothiorhodospiraceae bacterium 2226]|nr:alpha/beta hydrolase [Ectothiorhodospiraceae bacterium 2226]
MPNLSMTRRAIKPGLITTANRRRIGDAGASILILWLWTALTGCAVMREPTPTVDEFLARAVDPGVETLAYEAQGSGTPIVLIHGLGASRYTWRHLAEPLARRGQVIALDLKGSGDSPKPRDDAYSVYDQAALVLDVLARLDLGEVILVGHSFGGGVALATALRLQQEDRLAALILIGSTGYEQPLPVFIQLLKTPLVAPLGMRLLPARMQVRAIMNRAFHDNDLVSDAAVDEYAATLQSTAGRHALLRTARQIIPSDLDTLPARYASIEAPVLLLWGREDRIVPLEVGRQLHEALPHARLVILDAIGHMPQEEAPAATLMHVFRFLDEERLGR